MNYWIGSCDTCHTAYRTNPPEDLSKPLVLKCGRSECRGHATMRPLDGSLPEPCCPTRVAGRQGDPLFSASELALPDQATGARKRLVDYLKGEAAIQDVCADRYRGTHLQHKTDEAEKRAADFREWIALVLDDCREPRAQSEEIEGDGAHGATGSLTPPTGAQMEWQAMIEDQGATEPEGASVSGNAERLASADGNLNHTEK